MIDGTKYNGRLVKKDEQNLYINVGWKNPQDTSKGYL